MQNRDSGAMKLKAVYSLRRRLQLEEARSTISAKRLNRAFQIEGIRPWLPAELLHSLAPEKSWEKDHRTLHCIKENNKPIVQLEMVRQPTLGSDQS